MTDEPQRRRRPWLVNTSRQNAERATAFCLTRSPLTGGADKTKRRATKIRPKAAGSGIFGRFANYDKCRLGVAGYVISGVAVDEVSIDVRATFGESG